MTPLMWVAALVVDYTSGGASLVLSREAARSLFGLDAADIVMATAAPGRAAAIEDDLRAFAPRVLDLPDAEATMRLEQLIRSYDPCISCATHFLDVRIVRE